MNRLKQRAMAAALALALLWSATATCLWIRRGRVVAASARSGPVVSQAQDPLEQFRSEREALRARQTAQLNEILHAGDANPDTVAQARTQLLSLMQREEREMTLEGLLRARSFPDVLVNLSERAATVIVRSESLNRQQTAMILELVTRETGLSAGNVKIIPLN